MNCFADFIFLNNVVVILPLLGENQVHLRHFAFLHFQESVFLIMKLRVNLLSSTQINIYQIIWVYSFWSGTSQTMVYFSP